MLNILQAEDLVKGMPDQRLLQEAQAPQGQIPQYLTLSEIQRRADMRKRYKNQEQQPAGTVSDQIVNAGIAAVQPPQQNQFGAPGMPPGMMAQRPMQQMAGGGIVSLARGGRPSFEFPMQAQIPDFMPGFGMPSQATLPQQAMGRPDPNRMAYAHANPNARFMAGSEMATFTSYDPKEVQGTPSGGPYPAEAITPQAPLSQQATGGYEPTQAINGFLDDSGFAPNPGFPSMTLPDQDYGWQGPRYAEGGIVSLSHGGITGMGGYASPEAHFATSTTTTLEDFPPEIMEQVKALIEQGAVENTGIASLTKKKNPQRTGLSKIQVQGTGSADQEDILARYMAMANTESGSLPDFSDLVEQQRTDSYGNALIQLGAGIASGDTAAGMSRAGDVAYQGLQSARDLEREIRLLQHVVARDAAEASAEAEERKTAKDVNGRLRYLDTGEPVFEGVEVAPEERKTAKAADGFYRYLDTREKVFPDVEAAPVTPKAPIFIDIVNSETGDTEKRRVMPDGSLGPSIGVAKTAPASNLSQKDLDQFVLDSLKNFNRLDQFNKEATLASYGIGTKLTGVKLRNALMNYFQSTAAVLANGSYQSAIPRNNDNPLGLDLGG